MEIPDRVPSGRPRLRAERITLASWLAENGLPDEGIDHAFTRGYEKDDALRIGVNAIVYAQTH